MKVPKQEDNYADTKTTGDGPLDGFVYKRKTLIDTLEFNELERQVLHDYYAMVKKRDLKARVSVQGNTSYYCNPGTQIKFGRTEQCQI